MNTYITTFEIGEIFFCRPSAVCKWLEGNGISLIILRSGRGIVPHWRIEEGQSVIDNSLVYTGEIRKLSPKPPLIGKCFTKGVHSER